MIKLKNILIRINRLNKIIRYIKYDDKKLDKDYKT